jgi:hypothetical protein
MRRLRLKLRVPDHIAARREHSPDDPTFCSRCGRILPASETVSNGGCIRKGDCPDREAPKQEKRKHKGGRRRAALNASAQ